MARDAFRGDRLMTAVVATASLVVFLYAGASTHAMRRGIGLLPLTAAAVGIGCLALGPLQRFLPGRPVARRPPSASRGSSRSIEYVGEDVVVNFQGITRIFALSTVLLLGVSAVGPHIALTVYLCTYLRLYGGVKSYGRLVVVALATLVVLTVVYGELMRLAWPVSLMERVLHIRVQEELMRLVAFVF